MKPILRFQDVSLAYESVRAETVAVRGLSFEVGEGEFLAIVGPSGCGKSTVLSMAAGLIRPDEGKVLLFDQEVRGPNTQIGYMLQRDHLFEWRSIMGNALLGLKVQGQVSEAARARTAGLLKACGLSQFADRRPSELSGGMRQRAALARTLAPDPKILLLDEPFSALDYQTRLTLADEVHAIIKREQKTALFVTHDIAEAISLADRVLVLSSRPAAVRLSIPIELHSPTPFARRKHPGFQWYFNAIWKEMDENVAR